MCLQRSKKKSEPSEDDYKPLFISIIAFHKEHRRTGPRSYETQQQYLANRKRGAHILKILKEQGVYPHADLFFTSGLRRADETCELLYGSVDRKVIPDLSEFRFGLFEMKKHEELELRDDYQAWISDQSGDAACPGGESRQLFNKRVKRGYRAIVSTIRDSGVDSALVVCHGGVIVCIMEHLFPDKRDFYEWQPEPGHGYSIKLEPDGTSAYTEI